MTNEEAISRFKSFGAFCDDYNEACDGDCEMCSDMEDRIIEALEKQIPKKPIRSEHSGKCWCPSCNSEDGMNIYGTDFCPECGQRIDWSEVE